MYRSDAAAAAADEQLLRSMLLSEALAAAASTSASPVAPLPATIMTSTHDHHAAVAHLNYAAAAAAAAAASLPMLPQRPPHSQFSLLSSPPDAAATATALSATQLLNMALANDVFRFGASSPALSSSGILPARSLTTIVEPMQSCSATADMPLDLSNKSASLTPSPSRIAIKNGNYPTKTASVKRSFSSLSYRSAPDPDVSDHFKRSLSGKWPRRPISHSHYTPQQSLSPHAGRRTGSNPRLSHVVMISEGDGQVEDHFRRTFELRQSRVDDAADEDEEEQTSTTRL